MLRAYVTLQYQFQLLQSSRVVLTRKIQYPPKNAAVDVDKVGTVVDDFVSSDRQYRYV